MTSLPPNPKSSCYVPNRLPLSLVGLPEGTCHQSTQNLHRASILNNIHHNHITTLSHITTGCVQFIVTQKSKSYSSHNENASLTTTY